MSNFITKESISRLLVDIKQLIKEPLTDNGIFYHHDEEDILKGYALIIGPQDTPYFGGYYFFQFNFPNDYPHSPPSVTFCTKGNNIRFNPNLYKCGKICVSLLNTWTGEQWTSCQSISTVLLTLCTLLCKEPLLNEPGVSIHHKEIGNYNKIIEFANIDIAICDVLNKKEGLYLEFFDYFISDIVKYFIKNKDAIFNFIDNKIKEHNNNSILINGGYYSMSVNIDYNKLKIKILSIYNNLINK